MKLDELLDTIKDRKNGLALAVEDYAKYHGICLDSCLNHFSNIVLKETCCALNIEIEDYSDIENSILKHGDTAHIKEYIDSIESMTMLALIKLPLKSINIRYSYLEM